MVAVGPPMVVITLMFIIRPVRGHKQVRPSDGSSFTLVYCVCLFLATYLMAIMILEDLVSMSHNLVTVFTLILFVLLLIPIGLSFCEEPRDPAEEIFLPRLEQHEVVSNEFKNEKPEEVDSLVVSEGQKQNAQLQSELFRAAAEGLVRVKKTKGPRRGEDFTLTKALIRADFWLIMFSLLLGGGSGLTVIDNLGQMSQSLGYANPYIFVSMICIWNFLGHIAGGYVSEIFVRDHAHPRPIVIVMAQLVMVVGHVFLAMEWPGALYIGTLLVGLCYGAHWAIMPATVSKLFGLKKFDAFYNFLSLANLTGTLIFSSVIASSIYDYEEEKQVRQHRIKSHILGSILSGMFARDESRKCEGSICFFLSSMIMSGSCIIPAVLSMVLVILNYHKFYIFILPTLL
ncbi:hypothetical protein Goshw_017554 [Gossypium schwendimanii]|uniref:Nodulin-like domain-containing protein n=1 Tax=Gossypium schwendimanii TaxID=34291 RepID=A0A7J9LGX2_GOSSC|nr:hypothetical protein [Gossypium schwendimanii]